MTLACSADEPQPNQLAELTRAPVPRRPVPKMNFARASKQQRAHAVMAASVDISLVAYLTAVSMREMAEKKECKTFKTEGLMRTVTGPCKSADAAIDGELIADNIELDFIGTDDAFKADAEKAAEVTFKKVRSTDLEDKSVTELDGTLHHDAKKAGSDEERSLHQLSFGLHPAGKDKAVSFANNLQVVCSIPTRDGEKKGDDASFCVTDPKQVSSALLQSAGTYTVSGMISFDKALGGKFEKPGTLTLSGEDTMVLDFADVNDDKCVATAINGKATDRICEADFEL